MEAEKCQILKTFYVTIFLVKSISFQLLVVYDLRELTQGEGAIPHEIHPSPLKLALPAARLGGQPSLPWSPL